MNTQDLSTRDIGKLGELAAAEYLRRKGFCILGTNIARKTGEIDILAQKDGLLHFIEVKSLACQDFPAAHSLYDRYVPEDNLHIHKIRKVARTAEWLVAELNWNGEWQVDAASVWLRKSDRHALVHFEPQIL